MFLRTIEPAKAEGEVAAIYANEVASMGRVMQATQCWSARPDILAPVEHLLHQIRDGFSLGLVNFRLITLVTAKRVPSSYCSHVYFKALSSMIGREKTLAVYRDYRNAGLTERKSPCWLTQNRLRSMPPSSGRPTLIAFGSWGSLT